MLSTTFVWGVSGALIALILMQTIYVFMYFRFMTADHGKTDESNSTDTPYSPRVGIVLCLRGDDPSLKDCLNSLAAQTYSNFEIQFVFDDRQDPALLTVDTFLQESNGTVSARQHFLSHEISKNCSLKNQALITAISQANESIEVFALVDADGVVTEDWLENLVRPLAAESVGATTGSRWFAPSKRNIGSLVRQAWNAASLPQMSFYNIAWGGSLAIKRTTIENCNLLDHWSRAFCEDTVLTRVLRENQVGLIRVPSVIVENDESTTLGAGMTWISRQLLTVRLHHKSWPLVLGHALFSGACMIAAPVAVVVCILNNQQFQLFRLISIIIIFLLGNLVLLQIIQLANKRIFKPGSNDSGTIDPKLILVKGPGFIGALITQLIYPIAAIKTALMRNVKWRGITYKIHSDKTIEMVEYRPYRECLESESLDGSID